MCLLPTVPGFSQGRLNQAKEELNKEKEEKPASSTQTTYYDYDTEADETYGSGLLLLVLISTYYAIDLAHLTLFGKYKNETHLNNALTYYPYFDGASGNYLAYNGNIKHKPKRARADLSNHFLFTDDLYANHLKVKLRPSKYFYAQADYIVLIENILGDEKLARLNLYNFNFCYDRLRFNKFNLGWTMGANYVASGVGKSGLTYGLNMEAFFPKNISLFAAYKASKINGNPVNQLEIQGRLHVNRFFVSPGYEMIKIGSNNFHFIAVGAGAYF